MLEPTSGGVHPGRQPIRDLIEVTLVSPAEAIMVDPPPPIPKVVTGPKFCQTCGRPYDVVLPWYGVYCGVHRGYREPTGRDALRLAHRASPRRGHGMTPWRRRVVEHR